MQTRILHQTDWSFMNIIHWFRCFTLRILTNFNPISDRLLATYRAILLTRTTYFLGFAAFLTRAFTNVFWLRAGNTTLGTCFTGWVTPFFPTIFTIERTILLDVITNRFAMLAFVLAAGFACCFA